MVKSKTPSQLSSGERNKLPLEEIQGKNMLRHYYIEVVCILSLPFTGSVVEIKAKIKHFHRRFNDIKESTVQCLEKCQMAVKMVVFLLTSICAMDEHEHFLKKNYKDLHDCKNHWELFGMLNFYWNYLSYDLLDQLLEELTLKKSSFEVIAEEMEKYKTDLQMFRQCTTLKLFCRADTSTECDPPPEFRMLVVKHDWPDTVTLEDVEKFRRRYSQTYNLRKCAMMLHNIRPGSFTITWFVPVTVIDILRKKRAINVMIYKEFEVSRLEIYVQATAVCVYQTPVQRQVSVIIILL